MPEQPDSPFVPIDVDSDVPAVVRGQRRTWVSAGLMVAGLMCGLVGLVLVTNRYGNTGTMGLPVVGFGGLLFAVGFSHLFVKLRYAIVVGFLAGPMSVVLLFVVFWAYILVIGSFGR